MKRIVLFFIGFAFLAINNLHAQGSVGIGTGTPLAKLHISTDNSSVQFLENSSTLNTNVNNRIIFKTGSFYTGIIGTYGNGLATARMAFSTYANGNPANLFERMSILDNGYVGINNSAPLYRLDVTGDTRANGNLTVTGDVIRPGATGNMLPLAYGRINYTGNVVSGTGNFNSSKLTTGKFYISLPSESNLYSNQSQYIVLVSPLYVTAVSAQVYFTPDNKIAITLCTPVNASPAYVFEDFDFNFLVYKL